MLRPTVLTTLAITRCHLADIECNRIWNWKYSSWVPTVYFMDVIRKFRILDSKTVLQSFLTIYSPMPFCNESSLWVIKKIDKPLLTVLLIRSKYCNYSEIPSWIMTLRNNLIPDGFITTNRVRLKIFIFLKDLHEQYV